MMTDLELTVEALKRCVPKAAFEQAMEELKRPSQPVPRVLVASKVHEMLMAFGMPTNIVGFRFAMSAIKNAVLDPSLERQINRKLYAVMAEECDAVPGQVERGIRRAVEAAWDRGNYDALREFFGHSYTQGRGKTTNSQFITGVAAQIRREMDLDV